MKAYLVKSLFRVGGELRVRGDFPRSSYPPSGNIVDNACNSKSTADMCEELWWLTLGFGFHGASGNVAWPVVSPKSVVEGGLHWFIILDPASSTSR